MLGSPLGWEAAHGVGAPSPKTQQEVDEEIEECWRQVEKTAFRMERNVALVANGNEAEEAEKLLDGYRTGVRTMESTSL